MPARAEIDRIFEDEKKVILTPDSVYSSMGDYVTFAFVDGDKKYGVAVSTKTEEPTATRPLFLGHGKLGTMLDDLLLIKDSDMAVSDDRKAAIRKRLVWLGEEHPPIHGTKPNGWSRYTELSIKGRATMHLHGGYSAPYEGPVITFWDDTSEVADYVLDAVKLIHKADPSMPSNVNDYLLATATFKGSWKEMNGENVEFDAVRAKEVKMQQMLHLADPMAKAAMGVKPKYQKQGLSLADKQKLSTSESVIDFWMLPDKRDNLKRIHELAKKHSAAYHRGDHKSGLTFKFAHPDHRRSFASAVRTYTKRGGNVDV